MHNPFRFISWTQTAVISLTLLLVGAGIVTQQALKYPVRTTSTAAPIGPAPTAVPAYPSAPPRIDRLDFWFAKPGDMVRLAGDNFGSFQWGSQIIFNGQPLSASHITSWSDSAIDVTLPGDAASDPLTLTVNGQSTVSPLLTVYTHVTDPRLTLTQNEFGWWGTVSNLATPARLSLEFIQNNTTSAVNHTLSPGAPFAVSADSSALTLTHARLTDESGAILPLYMQPF